MVWTIKISITGMAVISAMTSAMTSATSNAMTSTMVIGVVVVMVMVVNTTPTGNTIHSQALSYLHRIANNVVAMPKRVVVAAVTME